MIKLSPQAHEVIRSCTLDDDHVVRITDGQLSRELYLEVASAFKNIGGKYERAIDGFRFNRSFVPNFKKFRETGQFNKKEALDFYGTPKPAADYVVENLSLFKMEHNYQAFMLRDNPGKAFHLCEPSAGHGALVDAFARKFREVFPHNPLLIDCVEMDPYNAEILQQKGYNVAEGDFLEFRAEQEYDLVLMNPPFSLKGMKDCYVDHVNHALSMLSSNGELAAIVPQSLLQAEDEKRHDLMSRIVRAGGIVDLEGPFNNKDTFRESGANVSTIGLYLTKDVHPDYLPAIDFHRFEVELLHGHLSKDLIGLQNRVASLGEKASDLSAKEFESMASFILDGVKKGVYVDRRNPTPFFKITAQCLDLDTRAMYPQAKKDRQIQFNF